MMKYEYTVGKWFSDGEGNIWRRHPKDLYQNGGGVAGDKPIAVCYKGWYGEGEQGYPHVENARRIAQCVNHFDSLLEALEKAKKLIRDYIDEVISDEVTDEIDAAIKQARGQ